MRINRIFQAVMALGIGAVSAFAAELKIEKDENGQNYIPMENRFIKLAAYPETGGKVLKFTYKPTQTNLTNTHGMLSDNVSTIKGMDAFQFWKIPYKWSAAADGWSLVLEARGERESAFMLVIRKTLNLAPERCSLICDYEFENHQASMATIDFGFWFHNILGVKGERNTYYYPLRDGIYEYRHDSKDVEQFYNNMTRGWSGVISGNGTGVAAVMDYRYLQCFYGWYHSTPVPSLEWRFIPVTLECTQKFNTQVEFIPFSGLKRISGAGAGVVGELSTPTELFRPGREVKVSTVVFNAEKRDLQLKLCYRHLPNGEWRELASQTLKYADAGTVQQLEIPFTPTEGGTIALNAVISDLSGKELAQLDRGITTIDSNVPYKLEPLMKQAAFTKNDKTFDMGGFKTETTLKNDFVKFGKPHANGPVKVLLLTPFYTYQDMSEIANRMDIELEYSFIHNREYIVWSVADNPGNATRNDMIEGLNKVLKKEYDVIVIGGLEWKLFNKDQQNRILEMVGNGTGVVYLGPQADHPFTLMTAAGKKLTAFKSDEIKFLKPDFEGASCGLFPSPLQILPWQVKSGAEVHATIKNIPFIVTGQYQKGRIVNINYNTNSNQKYPGLTPQVHFAGKNGFTWDYWEYYYSLIGKAILNAADRATDVALHDFKFESSNTLSGTLEGLKAGNQYQMEVIIRNAYHEKIAEFKDRTDANGKWQKSFEITPYSGMNIADMVIRDSTGKSVYWASCHHIHKGDEILKLSADRKAYKWGDKATITAAVSPGYQGDIMFALTDTRGRVLATGKDPKTFQCELKNELLSRRLRVIAKLEKEGREISRRQLDLTVEPREDQLKFDDFEIGMWVVPWGEGIRDYFRPLLSRMLKQSGIRTIVENNHGIVTEFSLENNFHPTFLDYGGIHRTDQPKEYEKNKDKFLLQRKGCLSDPGFVEKYRKNFEKFGNDQRIYTPRYCWIGDETSLTGYTGAAIDFCFSPTCVTHFREWAVKKYQTLEKLNESWDTSYKSWDEVYGMTREEAKARANGNYAPWADHLEYMNDLVAGYYENTLKAGLRKHFPQAKMGLSGTQPALAYGGMDYFKVAWIFDVLQAYHSGDQAHLHRSFGKGNFRSPWIGYASVGGEAGNRLYRCFANDSEGVQYFSHITFYRADFTQAQIDRDYLKYTTPLIEGVGKLKINNLKRCPEVAIYYSQPSLRSSFIREQDPKLFNSIWHKYVKLCLLFGIPFEFIGDEAIRNIPDYLDKCSYKLIFMPDVSAISDKEIEALRKFIDRGGVVVGEGAIGIMNENCRTLSKPDTDRIFVEGAKPFINVKPEKAKIIRAELGESLIRKSGKGTAILLNYMDYDYARLLQMANAADIHKTLQKINSIYQEIFKLAGIKPGIRLLEKDGQEIINTEIYPFKDKSGNDYYIIISDDRNIRKVRIELSGKAFVYGLDFAGKAADVREFETELGLGKPLFFGVFGKEAGKNFSCKAEGLDYTVSYDKDLDTVVRLTVINPMGKAMDHYAANLIVSNGEYNGKLPLALNDPKGKWTLSFRDILSGKVLETTVVNFTE